MNGKILDGFDAAIALMRSMQNDGSISADVAEDAMCVESFLSRMLDKMLTAEMKAVGLGAFATAPGSSEMGRQRPY